MRVRFWAAGAAAAVIIAFAGTTAGAAPALTGVSLKMAADAAAPAVEKAHWYRRYHRYYYRPRVLPFVYWGRPYWHRRYVYRRHWGDYGYFYRPWIHRYWR